jgi:hypothetical protein
MRCKSCGLQRSARWVSWTHRVSAIVGHPQSMNSSAWKVRNAPVVSDRKRSMAGPPGHDARPLDTPTASLCFLCISCTALTTTVNRLRADRYTYRASPSPPRPPTRPAPADTTCPRDCTSQQTRPGTHTRRRPLHPAPNTTHCIATVASPTRPSRKCPPRPPSPRRSCLSYRPRHCAPSPTSPLRRAHPPSPRRRRARLLHPRWSSRRPTRPPSSRRQ